VILTLRESALLVFGVVAALWSGCTTAPPQFPIGLYGVPPEDFPDIAAVGFDTVVTSPSRETLAVAKTNGIHIIANVSVDDRARIESIRNHPALQAWYLFDEPDLNRVSPATVASLNSQLHRLSRKPTIVVLMSGNSVEKYRNAADLTGVDWYPVPWAPVATVAREMRLARLASQGRPFYAILQAFDWKSSPELLRTNTPLRPPTAEEMRCMTYLALTQGASGLLFYTYRSDRWKIREHPQVWNALTDVVREVRLNAPIFAHRVLWWPSDNETHGPPSEMYNEILEARVLVSLYEVKKPVGAVRPGYYLVAVNSSASPTDFSFKLPFNQEITFDTSCSSAAFSIKDDWVRKTYAPFEVCIFGPISAPLSE
jgi:hypothetical protein